MADLGKGQAQPPPPPFQVSDEARARMEDSGYAAYANRQAELDRVRARAELARGDEDFRLPIDHQISQTLDTSNLERQTMTTPLPASNVGYKMLVKLGWKEGMGLGRKAQGLVEPIRCELREHKLGVGKVEQDDYYTDADNIVRKQLEIEIEETDEVRKRREEEAKREMKVQTELKDIKQVFYCEVCDKQYTSVKDYEAHIVSYEHGHRKRFKEMKEAERSRGRDDRLKQRAKKEQRQMEKEMAKYAALCKTASEQQQATGGNAAAAAPTISKVAGTTIEADPSQRTTLKFSFGAVGKGGHSTNSSSNKPTPSIGFSLGKGGPSATAKGTPSLVQPKKPLIQKKLAAPLSMFGGDSDEDDQ